ncbi:hypothetical protein GCM10010321_88730 [Streptomyces chartreusis]|nr:hypothetical protein GCM10010321_88730 [Streptomyces chartreusis]
MRQDLRALFEATGLPMRQIGPASQAAGYTGSPTSLSTLSSYLTIVDQPIGTDTVILEGLVAQLLALTRATGHPAAEVWADTRGWKHRWELLKEQPEDGRPQLPLLGAPARGVFACWDGAGDDVLLSEHTEASWLVHPRLGRLAAVVGELHHLALPVEAARLAQILRDTAARLFPADAEQTLAARHVAAYWTGEAGDAEAARVETSVLLSDCLAALGTDHPLSHLARLRLAVCEERCGNIARARRLFHSCVDDADFPGRLQLLARLGLARSLEDIDGAEAARQLDGLLPELRDTCGSNHPTVLAARLDSAMARLACGANPAAIMPVVEELVSEAVSLLGNDHPVTLRIRTRHVLSLDLETPGAERFEELATTVLRDVRRVRGDLHVSVFYLRSMQATLILLRDPREGHRLLEALAQETREHLGDRHPATLSAQYHAIVSTFDSGKDEEIRSLDQWLPRATEVLGRRSRIVQTARHLRVLAIALSAGEEAARPLYEQLVAELTQELGEDHPDTLFARVGQAFVLAECLSPHQARLLVEALLCDQIRVLGSDHWTVLLMRRSVCRLTQTLEGSATTLPAYTQLLADYERVHGTDHPHTRSWRECTNAIRAALEYVPEKRQYWENRLATQSPDADPADGLGPLTSRVVLAELTLDSEGPTAAVPLYEELLPELEIHQRHRPSTQRARHVLEAAGVSPVFPWRTLLRS